MFTFVKFLNNLLMVEKLFKLTIHRDRAFVFPKGLRNYVRGEVSIVNETFYLDHFSSCEFDVICEGVWLCCCEGNGGVCLVYL